MLEVGYLLLSVHSQCSDKQLPDWTRRVLIKDHFRNGDVARGLLIFICDVLHIAGRARLGHHLDRRPRNPSHFFSGQATSHCGRYHSAFALVGVSLSSHHLRSVTLKGSLPWPRRCATQKVWEQPITARTIMTLLDIMRKPAAAHIPTNVR